MKKVSESEIISKIYVIRGEKVMLDSDLAELYDVTTKYLKRQVRRNIDRFPEDFMFELTAEEYQDLRSQIGTLKQGQHSKYLPMVFTEQGVAQLSSVVNSERAIKVNIGIIRLFTKMRRLLMSHKDLILKIEKIEQRLDGTDHEVDTLFEYLKKLMKDKEKVVNQESRKRIGFDKKK
jgi:hypothetical protein